MNLLDAKIIEILSKPYSAYGRWFVDVKITCWGRESTTEVMRNTEAEAAAVQVGQTIQI